MGNAVMFTGHRLIPAAEVAALRESTAATIRALIDRGYEIFWCGGALGFDTLAAQVVLQMKETRPELRLHLALPCLNQERLWRLRDREEYAHILSRADCVHYTAYAPYYAGCMQLRNRYMVENAAVCVAYFNSLRGGTSSTVQLAKRAGLTVYNLCQIPKQAVDGQMTLTESEEGC